MAAPSRFLSKCCRQWKHVSRLSSASIFTSPALSTDSQLHPVSRPQTLAGLFQKAEEQIQKTRRPIFATQESNPANHTEDHIGLFYTVPEDVAKTVLYDGGIYKPFYRLCETLGEMCLMIRRPAVEVIKFLKASDFIKPINRYVFYGPRGSGKGLSLLHVLHYCHTQDWLIVHVPRGAKWAFYCPDTSPSTYSPGRLDSPAAAAEWLTYFQTQNDSLLKRLDLRTSARYTWSKREVTEEGVALTDVLLMGTSRIKFASDCVGVLLKELKQQCQLKGFKMLVAVNGVNGFFTQTGYFDEEKARVPVENLTLVHSFKKLLQNDWTSGAVVCSVQDMCNEKSMREFDLPKYLLGKKGFEILDPFLPIEVQHYSRKEMHSCIEYHIDRKWIQNPLLHTEEGREEMIFLSGRNPFLLSRLMARS